MADLFLTWDEARGEQLPHYCVSCAAPATEWADWRICQTQYLFLSTRYTYVDVTLPVCPQHRNLHWFILQRVVARRIQNDGVVLGHVSPGFVEAVWDYRDDMETRPRPAPAPRFAPAPRTRTVESEEHDYEEYSPKSLPRKRYANGRYNQPAAGWSFGKIVLVVMAVLFFAPCGAIILFALLGLLIKLVFG
jgi:hypothetical protein